MPLPSSGDGRFLSQKPGKIKTILHSNSRPDTNRDLTEPKKNKMNNRKSDNLNKQNTSNTVISPNLQHIIDNHPTLNINIPMFNYDNASTSQAIEQSNDVLMSRNDSTDDSTTSLIGNARGADNTGSEPGSIYPNPHSNTHQQSTPGHTYKEPSSFQHLKHFDDNFTGIPVIIIELIDTTNTNGLWHPLKWAKLLCNNFFGIKSIKPNGFRKINATFESIFHANTCLGSPLLTEHKLSAYIPSTLIFSHGIIKLDTSLPEEDFWEGLKSDVPVVAFKRISANRDGSLTPTRLVELRFLSQKIPQNISIFNVRFEVSPSVRSPLQCNNCLRFGHTSKFCRSKPRCSHCGESNHSLNTCPSTQTTEPRCLFCHLPHLATDRSCNEWNVQRDIKKIMATENLSFKEATNFKKQNQVTSAFSYSKIVNKQPIQSYPTKPSPSPLHHTPDQGFSTNNIHQLSKKPRYRSPPRTEKHFHIPKQNNFSLPNGSFLKHVSNHTSINESKSPNSDFTWVNTLAHNLSESLLNSPDLSSQTATSLQNIIESSIFSLLATPNFSSIPLNN